MADKEYFIIDPDGNIVPWVDPVAFPLSHSFIFRSRSARVRRVTNRTIWLEWADYVRPLWV